AAFRVSGTSLRADAATRTGPEVVDVIRGRSGRLSRVGEHTEVTRGRQSALVGVEHVEPGQHRAVQRLHADPDLVVQAELAALPAVQLALVRVTDVVEHHEHAGVRVRHDGGQRTLPPEIFATEGQTPSFDPPGPGHRGMGCALHHL